MSREPDIPSSLLQQIVLASDSSLVNEPPDVSDPVASSTQDSNNNISLGDGGRTSELASAESNRSFQSPPAVREIHKNSWLKRMPCVDRWSGKFPKSQKPEKFWVVFCVHDDKEAYLEFYENRRSAYSHMPLSQVSLCECLHISPTIVAQENDHEFVITLETQVIRLAASTNEQMLEWMDTMRNKLRELGVLEPKDNLYSKEPITSCRPSSFSAANDESTSSFESQTHDDISRLSLRDPNSPLPPVPDNSPQFLEMLEGSVSNSTVVYVRNPPILRASMQSSSNLVSNPSENEISDSHDETQLPLLHMQENTFNIDVSSDSEQDTSLVSRSNSVISCTSVTSGLSSTGLNQRIASSLSEEVSLYEPLFHSGVASISQPLVSISIRNPNYENPPAPQRRIIRTSSPAIPPRPMIDQRRMSSSMVSDIQNAHFASRIHGLSNLTSLSDSSLNASLQSNVINSQLLHSEISIQPILGNSPVLFLRTQSHQEAASTATERGGQIPQDEGPPPYGGNGAQYWNLQCNSSTGNCAIQVDENGKPLSLREAQVLRLQAEILHKSGVRLVLRKKDCVNAIALVESFNSVWVAGWKQKEHPLLHNTFHVGDRIISIAGHKIHNVQDAHKAIKHQPAIVEFIVRRTPCGKALAIKKEYEGQDLGIIREGGTAEIKEVKDTGLAFRYGLSVKAPTLDGNSLCNWVLTEINHRPLNLFFKDNEVQDRLNAVGLDISILVQPQDLVKSLKKQLKALRSYKEYIVQ